MKAIALVGAIAIVLIVLFFGTWSVLAAPKARGTPKPTPIKTTPQPPTDQPPTEPPPPTQAKTEPPVVTSGPRPTTPAPAPTPSVKADDPGDDDDPAPLPSELPKTGAGDILAFGDRFRDWVGLALLCIAVLFVVALMRRVR